MTKTFHMFEIHPDLHANDVDNDCKVMSTAHVRAEEEEEGRRDSSAALKLFRFT
jgi:hypothetical protein